MAKKYEVTNGIFEQDGRFYMMCGNNNVEIQIINNAGTRLISKNLKRTPVVTPERTPA